MTGFQTKEEIHAKLGEPSAWGIDEHGEFEEYHTRRMIAAPMKMTYFGPGYAMGLVMTCGAIELILVPYELYLVGRRGLFGQTVRVTYKADIVDNIHRDGEGLFLLGISRSQWSAPRTVEGRAEENASPPTPSLAPEPTNLQPRRADPKRGENAH